MPGKDAENIAYIAIGSNIGNRIDFMRQATALINNNEMCSTVIASAVYETKPYGDTEQQNFFNAVIKIKTLLSLDGLFELLKHIETRVGRNKSRHWGPREIDLDLLFYNDVIYSDERLTVPHKDVQNRDFVLVPLCEISPDFVHPVLDKKVCDIYIKESEKCVLRKTSGQLL